jgi:predicted nucleic acid-binding protein
VKICPNTSPLLVLARLDRLDLVGEPSRVVLTSAVLAEVHDKLDAISARIDRFGSQCTIVDPAPVGSIDVLRSLGPGEKSVLSWALSVGSDVLCVFDDAAARAEARRLGLGVTGTLGLVLRAKADGRLDEAAPLLRRAVAAGLYLDDAVLAHALARVGEQWT